MGRVPCCDKADVNKGAWSPEEDSRLKQFMEKNGNGGNWISLPHKAGLKRCGKSCRLRWLNYLSPNIKHGGFSDEEDRIIWALFSTIGTKWSVMAAQLSGRTDNAIKNHWNTKLKKKLMAMASKSSLLKPNDPCRPPSSFDRTVSFSFGPFQTLDSLTSGHYCHSMDDNVIGSCSSSGGSFAQFSHGGAAEIKEDKMGFMSIGNGFQEKENAIQFNKNPNQYKCSCQENPLDQSISSACKNNNASNKDSLMTMEEYKDQDLKTMWYRLLKSTEDLI